MIDSLIVKCLGALAALIVLKLMVYPQLAAGLHALQQIQAALR